MYCQQPPTTPPPSAQWHYYLRQIASTTLPTSRGSIAWLARARVYVHDLYFIIVLHVLLELLLRAIVFENKHDTYLLKTIHY